MKFTIERQNLVDFVKIVSQKMPDKTRADKSLKVFACAARAFVEANETTAGVEALVLQDGACWVDAKLFLKLLRTYKERDHLIFEAGPKSLAFGNTVMNIVRYSETAIPPAKFQVFPVTDTWVAQRPVSEQGGLL